MDDSRFDALAKRLARPRSRRETLKGLAKTITVGLGIGGPIGTILNANNGMAASCRDGGAVCTGHGHCCSGACGEADRFRRRRCTCPAETTTCGTRCCATDETCVNDVCRPLVPGCGTGGPCTIFVTELVDTGNLGGLAGADAICAAEAAAANLSGTYKAWLSDSSTSAAARLVHSTGPYRLVDGTVVADNWADLTDGSIDNFFYLKANGFSVASVPRTGTSADGSLHPSSLTCQDWTSDSSSEFSVHGSTQSLDSGWTAGNSRGCNESGRLYCIQQSET